MTDPAHPLFAQLYDPVMSRAEETRLPEHRRYLVSGISGSVLNLGAGTGAMFPYFQETVEGAELSLHAVEPDPHMRRQAVAKSRELGLDVEIDDAGAEALPYADDTIDFVVASLVFCTIPDVETALSEIARVLKPSGEFRFLEHVRGGGNVGVAYDVLAPAWHAVAGGCHLNRQTVDVFRSDERFELIDCTRVNAASAIPKVLPEVRGTLERRET